MGACYMQCDHVGAQLLLQPRSFPSCSTTGRVLRVRTSLPFNCPGLLAGMTDNAQHMVLASSHTHVARSAAP